MRQTSLNRAEQPLVTEPQRFLVGKIVNDELDFTFEIWAYAKLADQQLQQSYRALLEDTNKRKIVPGTVIRQLTNHGLKLNTAQIA